MVLLMCFAVTCWLTRSTRDILTNKGFFLKSSSVQSWYLTHPVESLVCSSRKSMLLAKVLPVIIYLNKYSAMTSALLCCEHFNFIKPKLLVVSRIYGGTWMDSYRGWEEIFCYFWGPRTWTLSCLMLPMVHYTFYLFQVGHGGVGVRVKMSTVFTGHFGQNIYLYDFGGIELAELGGPAPPHFMLQFPDCTSDINLQ